MIDPSIIKAPVQYPVTDQQLELLSFSLEMAVQLEEPLVDPGIDRIRVEQVPDEDLVGLLAKAIDTPDAK